MLSPGPEDWRQLAWTSHANAHLAGGFPVDQWYRHGLFFDVAFSFREWPSRKLIADGVFDWLSAIEAAGAMRLSVEPAPEIKEDTLSTADLRAVVVHYRNRREVWRRAWEQSVAWTHQATGFIHNRDAYQADVDAYFLVSTIETPETPAEVFDWAAIRSHAYERLASHDFYRDQVVLLKHPTQRQWLSQSPRTDMPEWATLATLPEDPALLIPHQLLSTLAGIYSAYANDTNGKNDSSALNLMATEESGRLLLSRFDDALSKTFDEVYSAASSETRWQVPESAWRSPEALWKRERAESKPRLETSSKVSMSESIGGEPSVIEQPVPEPEKFPWAGMLVLLSLVGGIGYLAWRYPNTLSVIAIAGVFIYLLRRR